MYIYNYIYNTHNPTYFLDDQQRPRRHQDWSRQCNTRGHSRPSLAGLCRSRQARSRQCSTRGRCTMLRKRCQEPSGHINTCPRTLRKTSKPRRASKHHPRTRTKNQPTEAKTKDRRTGTSINININTSTSTAILELIQTKPRNQQAKLVSRVQRPSPRPTTVTSVPKEQYGPPAPLGAQHQTQRYMYINTD